MQNLLNNGADVNLSSEEGFTPHMQHVQLDIRELSKNYNAAEVNLCSKEEFSPLHAACANGHDTIVQV